ncbi:MAG: DUF599 family protein [Pseudomonadota bacterium]
MLPSDMTFAHGAAVAVLLSCWFSYTAVLKTIGRGSLNVQLATVRRRWIERLTHRSVKPFDAILLGQIVNAIAFFGSATLLVLAGVITAFAALKGVHATVQDLDFISSVSLELFALQLGFLGFILALCFFSFTYALRKLIYVLALAGALPDQEEDTPDHDAMREATAAVLSEAVKTFNFGIRGYYYAVAALAMFISPWGSIIVSIFVTIALFYRQLGTPTARAIQRYVEAQHADEQRGHKT